MRKDYVRTKKVTSRPKRSPHSYHKKPKKEGRLWLLACGLIAVFIIGLVFLKQEGVKLAQHQKASPKKEPAQIATVKTKSAAAPAIPQPRFDFYTMLPSEKVATVAPEPDATAAKNSKKVADTNNKVITSPANRNAIAALAKQQIEQESSQAITSLQDSLPKATTRYILQFGVYKDFASADELKAQLVLQGVEAKIKTIKRKEETWYRVCLGPYKTIAQASKIQQKLKSEQVKSSVVKSD